jgi:hypothetical protein
MWRLTTVLMVSLALLLPTLLTAGSNSAKLRWQDGQILSRKTVPTGRGGIEYEYVYRLRGGDAHYVVVSRQPLKVGLQTPVKFATTRRHVWIQDADGKECKLSMVERRKRAFGRW